MAQETQPIRTAIDTKEVDDANLDMLREDLKNNKPELLRDAASELLTAKRRLDSLVSVIDRHLTALDKHWTVGEDAKTVKTSLSRLRSSTADVSTTISEQTIDADAKQCLANPSGVAPALIQQAHTLSALSGKSVPESENRDVSVLEGAFQGGVAGTIGGSLAGPPGMVVGAVVGTLAGGVTALFTDGPFGNIVGDSKEEKNRKAAKEHIKLLTEATEQNNRAFPADLRTDIPQFDTLDPRIPKVPFPGGDRTDGTVPAGLNQSITSPNANLDGLGYPNQDGLRDPNLHQIPGLGDTDPGNGTLPDGSGLDSGVGDVPGSDLSGAGKLPDAPGLGNTPSTNTNLPNTSLNAPNTSLAGLPDPSSSLNTPSPSTSLPNTTSGIGNPYGGGGAGNGMTGTGNAASALRGLGGAGSPMMVPPGGRGNTQESQESSRTTWLLEDEDYFRSDEATTNPYLRGDTKGKA
ncbi:hypothetical protein [Nonomuraea insulae]|uniref:Uncharacterized protein n=1 Tax=Nonomuraea insulae TaxID=1616787 RepID=A0ABW1CPR7_9ACTN